MQFFKPLKITSFIQRMQLAVLAGILGILAFPPFGISFTAWIAMVPLLLAVKGLDLRRAFLLSYLAGIIFFSGILYWLLNVTVPGTIVLVLILALFYGTFGMLASVVFKYSMDLLMLPFIWVVLEYIRANLFTGFPWAVLGTSQYTNINIIQVADMTGAYGVSFLLIAFNAALYSVVTGSKRKISYLMISLIFILMATTYGKFRSEMPLRPADAKLSVIQGNIPQSFKWDTRRVNMINETYASLTRQAAKDRPDMILWPETSYPNAVSPNRAPREIDALAKETGIPILAGVVFSDEGKYYNGAAVFDGDKGILASYYKTHLVPFGEYIPFETLIAKFRDYIDKPIGNFGRGDKYTLMPLETKRTFIFDDNTISKRTNFYRIGVMICFEDVFPYVAREFVLRGASFLVNITNDAWFGRSAASEQHLQSSVFRAVENRVPVVRAANTGISCFIDPVGRTTSRLTSGGEDIFIEGYLTNDVSLYPTRSFYTIYGDVFVYFCAFMLVILFITEGMIKRKS